MHTHALDFYYVRVQMPDLRPRLAATLQQLGTSGTWKVGSI